MPWRPSYELIIHAVYGFPRFVGQQAAGFRIGFGVWVTLPRLERVHFFRWVLKLNRLWPLSFGQLLSGQEILVSELLILPSSSSVNIRAAFFHSSEI